MSRIRDIASILSNTEQANPDNNAIDASTGASTRTSVFTSLDSLPITGLSSGQQAFITSTNRLYVSNGSGWYNTALISADPNWDSSPLTEYTIVDSVTPLVIIAKATDSDNINLLNQSVASDSAQYMVDITIDSSVFTFTPKSADSVGEAVVAGNLTDSNGDFIYTFKWSDGVNFVTQQATITYSPASATGISYLGTRGFHAGGNGSTFNIGYFDITTSANTAYFGDMQGKFSQMGGVGDGARIVTMGGYDNNKSPPRSDQIQYWASATTGNALDFGNLTQVKEKTDGVVGDATRAVVGGGYGASSSVVNEMDYITIQTTGNAQDFGDLTQARDEIGNTNDATRGVFIQGEISGQVSTQDYITVQTTGNATSFGNATHSVYGCHSGICADETRGLYMGGITSGNSYAWDTIEYVVIQTTGSATDFGNMDNGRSNVMACSDGTTGVIMGGFAYPTGPSTQHIQKVTIQTTGNATDFGGDIYGSGSNTQDGAGMSGNAA